MKHCVDRMIAMYASTVSGWVSRLWPEAQFGQLKEFLTAFFLP